MKRNWHDLPDFYWQNGYAGFSVSPDLIERVTLYIDSQKEHHKKINFQDELRAILKKYKKEYDERYLWD